MSNAVYSSYFQGGRLELGGESLFGVSMLRGTSAWELQLPYAWLGDLLNVVTASGGAGVSSRTQGVHLQVVRTAGSSYPLSEIGLRDGTGSLFSFPASRYADLASLLTNLSSSWSLLAEGALDSPAESSGIIRGVAGSKYRAVACAIRNSGAGFQLIDDAGHTPIGVVSVSTDGNDNVVINYDFTALTVGSLVVTPDETFAMKGYTVGASVGLSAATLNIGSPGIWSDYIYWDVPTLAFKSFNGLAASITPHTNAALAAAGHYLYLFNSAVSMTAPLYGGSMSCRTSTYTGHLESFGPAAGGTYGGFGFRFADAATRVTAAAMVDGSDGNVNMKGWVMLNSTFVRKVPTSELVSTSGNFWVHGVFQIE